MRSWGRRNKEDHLIVSKECEVGICGVLCGFFNAFSGMRLNDQVNVNELHDLVTDGLWAS
jgi:hypothetical protein